MIDQANTLRAERNAIAKQVKAAMGANAETERATLVNRGKEIKNELVTLESLELGCHSELLEEAARVPNETHPEVPKHETVVGLLGDPLALGAVPAELTGPQKPVDEDAAAGGGGSGTPVQLGESADGVKGTATGLVAARTAVRYESHEAISARLGLLDLESASRANPNPNAL